MDFLAEEPHSMVELVRAIADTVKALRATQKSLPALADGAGEIIAGVYEYAGAGDAVQTIRGNEIQSVLLSTERDIEEIVAKLNIARGMAREAVQTMGEADARRKDASRQLRV